ncbi:hypothetical protein CWC10_19645, partial [Pseudoalteromonas sp. S3173]
AQGINGIPAAPDYHDFAAFPWYKQRIPNAKALRGDTRYAHYVIGKAWINVRRTIDPDGR